ncbi:MAG: polymer-forming cytoskeletal protein [Thermodesulfobacteriota bacterium]
MFGKDVKKPEVREEKEIIGFIGKGMTVEGKLGFNDSVRIEGVFKGEINSGGTLIVGESGEIEADIEVDTAIVNGEIKGTLSAKTRVELNAPGKVYGDIRTPTLVISEGVTFEGNCLMTGDGRLVVKPVAATSEQDEKKASYINTEETKEEADGEEKSADAYQI